MDKEEVESFCIPGTEDLLRERDLVRNKKNRSLHEKFQSDIFV